MLTETQVNEDFKNLYTFLSYFNYDLITISPQVEKGRPYPPYIKGNILDTDTRVRAFTLEELKNPLLIEDFKKFQSRGYAIFFMANEGDGVVKGNHKTCAARVNVTKLKALFIDIDTGKDEETKKLLEAFKENKIPPHLMVSSSPKKYHFYFLLEDTPATEENIIYWEALQKRLGNLIPGLDKSVSDTCQLLRLPDFYNVKKELSKSHLVTLQAHPDFSKIPKYNLKDLYIRLGAEKHSNLKASVDEVLGKPYLGNGNGNGHVQYTKYEHPAEGYKYKPGERRPGICRFIEHALGNLLPLEAPDRDYFYLIDSHIITCCTPEDAPIYLHGGDQRQNIINYYNDRKSLRIREKYEREIRIKEANHEVGDSAVEALPDSFYLGFPGDLGMLTREICDYSKKLPKEMAFAGALCISGFMKAESFRFKGAWPLINGFIVAGSGTGKSVLKNVIERTLRTAGMRGKYSRYIPFKNTVQALHDALYASGGVGTTIVDETGDYLKNITAKHAPASMSAIKKYYKEATTAIDEGNELSPGGSVNNKTPVVLNGALSLWMLIQPGKFTASINLEDMEDGFLPRFFVFNGKSDLVINETNIFKSFSPSMDLKVWLEGHGALFPIADADSEGKKAVEELKKIDSKAKNEVIRAVELEAVHRARTEARLNPNSIISVGICNVGERLIQEYLDKRQVELDKLEKNAPEIPIYIRIPEMLNRLLCNASTYDFNEKKAVVTAEIVEKCIEFSEFQVNRFFRNELENIAKGTGEHEEELVLDSVKKFHNKYKEYPTVAQIKKTIRSTSRPRNILDPIRRLVEAGVLEKIVREHKKDGTKKVVVFGIRKEEEIV